MPRRSGLCDVTVTKGAERNPPFRRPVRISVYAMCFGVPPCFRFGLDFLGSAEQHRKFLVSPIGLFLTETPNPNRRPSESFLPFDPAELVRVSPQQSFSSIRGAKSDLRVCQNAPTRPAQTGGIASDSQCGNLEGFLCSPAA